MRKFATADCETDPFLFGRVPEPFIWGFYDNDFGFQYFFKTEDFIEFIKEYKGIIYMHNGGKFDFYFLFQALKPQEKVMVINGRIAKLKIGECEIRDSYLLLPVPLSAYKKDEIDYTKMEKNQRFKHITEIVEYLKGDCKYLWDILSANFEDYGQKLTLASSAFDYWNKNFNEEKKKPQSGQSFYEHFNKFYYGGRVQCFEKGIIEDEFQLEDINSAYPYAMQENHPIGNRYDVLSELPEKYEQCFIQLKAISNGILPFREKGRLTFPDDGEIREYFATGWELKLGLEKGLIKIKDIIKVYQFEKQITFKPYVDHFFKMKAEYKDKDEARYLLTKLYLNSLYGKFGQSSLKHRDYSLIEPEYTQSYIEQDYDFEGEIGENSLVSKPISENHMKFYNVLTAASITGFVRAYLYRHILECERPLYCDTDSIAFIGKSNFIEGKECGQWENQGIFEKGAIGGKKLYAFKYKNKNKYKISSKGARLNEKEIFDIARGDEVIYKNIAPTFSIGSEPKFLTRKIKMT